MPFWGFPKWTRRLANSRQLVLYALIRRKGSALCIPAALASASISERNRAFIAVRR